MVLPSRIRIMLDVYTPAERSLFFRSKLQQTGLRCLPREMASIGYAGMRLQGDRLAPRRNKQHQQRKQATRLKMNPPPNPVIVQAATICLSSTCIKIGNLKEMKVTFHRGRLYAVADRFA